MCPTRKFKTNLVNLKHALVKDHKLCVQFLLVVMSLAKSHRVIPEPPFSPFLSAVDLLDLSVAASSNLRLQLFSPPECQEESCEGQEKEEDCEGGQDLYQCELLSNFKRTKSALGKISGLYRLTIEDYPCALVAGQPLRGRRQPATKVRRWNISQEPHGRISGSDLDPFSPHKREIKQPPRYQGLRNFH